jgi:hypothetical protein
MPRPLVEYLPPAVKEVREFRAAVSGEQPEIDLLRRRVKDARDDQFVMTATENRIKQWEGILRITPRGTETLDERKYNVVLRRNERLPYTYRMVERQLDFLCGVGGYTMILDHKNYKLTVKLELVSKYQYEAVVDLLRRIVPANMVIDVDLRYNQYQSLQPYTYGYLAGLTHEQLRSEVL